MKTHPMFHQIVDAFAVTRINGLFRQTPLFKHRNRMYVKHGSGYAWVMKGGDTSVPNLRIDELVLPFKEAYDKLGYLTAPDQVEN